MGLFQIAFSWIVLPFGVEAISHESDMSQKVVTNYMAFTHISKNEKPQLSYCDIAAEFLWQCGLLCSNLPNSRCWWLTHSNFQVCKSVVKPYSVSFIHHQFALGVLKEPLGEMTGLSSVQDKTFSKLKLYPGFCTKLLQFLNLKVSKIRCGGWEPVINQETLQRITIFCSCNTML